MLHVDSIAEEKSVTTGRYCRRLIVTPEDSAPSALDAKAASSKSGDASHLTVRTGGGGDGSCGWLLLGSSELTASEM